ncbi:DUF929 family protein [Dictyobacter formicarum]|uniref:DUF929 domain-containing protein n=1 Tax=Dictyobacter formicarum TaxID=2778368 RepID=A0ABQ3VS18_9CHLR|nr:DUF929 family protein [Dictyobacter formicarum]GHO89069.1 hypothetical protein KSZ_70750 [Dictyobacter formicarum]
MTKSKHPASAAQRREQERLRRAQQRNTNTRSQSSGRRRMRRSARNTWLLLGGIILGLALVIGSFIYFAQQQKATATNTATPSVFQQLTTVKPELLSTVGSGGLEKSIGSILKPVKGAPILKGPSGKPEIFYMGGDFCPYCGAQRWPMIIALSKFGTFEKPLTPIISSESNVPTYSFHQAAYKSNYIDFTPVEVGDNQQPPQPLDKLTPQQEQLVKTYDAPPYTSAENAGSFPFMSVGNQFVSIGSYYSPTLLVGHSFDDIVSQMQTPTTDISRNMLGSANYTIAQICKVTNNQPGKICTADPIPTIQGKLPRAAIPTGNATLANVNVSQLASRRQHM